MQYTKGKVTGQVRLSGARMDKLEEIIQLLPPRIKITKEPDVAWGTNNRHSLLLNVSYGPVWGGWESDVRKAFHKAIKRAGSTARLDYDNLRREIVEYRRGIRAGRFSGGSPRYLPVNP